MRGYRIFRTVLSMAVVILALGFSALIIRERNVIGRVRYVWSGSGVGTWEEAAQEAGVVSEAEEYYYENLPEEFREAYREIYVHIMRNEDSGPLYAKIDADSFWKTYYAVLADHPEIFWIASSAQIEQSGLTKMVVNYSFDTVVPQEARASMKEKLEYAADVCIGQIPADASDYEKIKSVYEYIIGTTEYDPVGADNQNIQSVLLYQRSVCAGYAKAFQYILNRMGLFCTYITGTIHKESGGGDGSSHGWNMVRIGEQYYYVDVTWGDPVFMGQIDNSENRVMNYNYLCCTQEDLFKTHTPDGSVPLPECTADDYNYYKINNMYYETFDHDTIYNKVMESVWAGETSITMKFGSEESYEQARYEMFEGELLKDALQYLMEINGKSSWNYRYNVDPEFGLITVYWY